MRKFLNLFKSHYSFIPIIFGAGALFLSNILAKEFFSPQDYGYYSILITYFSIVFLFGIFGGEQLFIRISERPEPHLIETSRKVLGLVLGALLVSTVAGSVFFWMNYREAGFSLPIAVLVTLSMALLLFLVNILRLDGQFFLAQAAANFWKVMLVLISLAFLFFSGDWYVFKILLAASVIISVAAVSIYIARRIKFSLTKKISTNELVQLAFHFFIAISGFTLITFADRVLIEQKYSVEEFGNFFYLSNFFLAPFSIVQNYFGFKQLIAFKTDYNKLRVRRYLLQSILSGLGIGTILISMCWTLSQFNIVTFRFLDYIPAILLLLLTGLVRLYSSTVLSAFEARTTLATLKQANFFIAVATVLLFTMLYCLAESIESILAGILAIWIIRCIIHQILLRKLN